MESSPPSANSTFSNTTTSTAPSLVSITLPSSITFFMTHLNTLITLKLDSSNFSLWRDQFITALGASKLYDFLIGSSPLPKNLTVNGQVASNPQYTQWLSIDRTLMSCLKASLTPHLLSRVLHRKSPSKIWNALYTRFTTFSRAHLFQLKDELRLTHKKDLSMKAYLSKIRSICDKFSLAGEPLKDDEVIYQILKNLTSYYNNLRFAVRLLPATITLDELSSLLISEDINLAFDNSSPTTHDPTTAYTAINTPNSTNFTYRPSFGQSRGRFTRFSPNRGRSSSRRNNLPLTRVTCQICGRPNHTAVQCWHCLNSHYHGSAPTLPSPTIHAFTAFTPSSPRLITTPISEESWFVDSDAN